MEFKTRSFVSRVTTTESAIVEASQEHNDALIRLRRFGIRLAIDDFGTGYSSLGYIARFPVDHVKIGQGIMPGLTSDSNNAKIVKAAI
jgi:EAL domain-containing protein (putative c-di-GMP-specific phosphodiesterase class I)